MQTLTTNIICYGGIAVNKKEKTKTKKKKKKKGQSGGKKPARYRSELSPNRVAKDGIENN